MESGNFDFGIQLLSSQESNLDDNELDNIIIDSKPTNTKKCTNWGCLKLKKWAEKRNVVIDLKVVSVERLNEILRKFYAEVKTEKNGTLTPSALTGIRAAINRNIVSPPYSRSMNIIADREFTTANQMFTAKCKLYYRKGNKKPQHKALIERPDMLLLNAYFDDPLAEPVKLQEFVWFSLCFHFGRRGREGWRELQKDHFSVKSDAENHRYVTIQLTESTKNNPGGHKQSNQDYSDVRMYENIDSPLDPVRAFEFYVSKLHPENTNLFAKSRKHYSKGEIWYTRDVIGKNTLVNIMTVISSKAGLSQVYTNHCVRASTVTTLYQAGVDTQRICSITKHKGEGTLTHYISSSTDQQKREASLILTSALDKDASNLTKRNTYPIYQEEIPSEPIRKSSSLMQSVMPNATFKHCTINFNGFLNFKFVVCLKKMLFRLH